LAGGSFEAGLGEGSFAFVGCGGGGPDDVVCAGGAFGDGILVGVTMAGGGTLAG